MYLNLGLINQRGILRRLREGSASSTRGDENAALNGGDVNEGQKNSFEVDHGTEDDVLLVRRRSGGGTVFHDAGNVNYSVICPPASFDRNKHAEMVVRALQALNKTPHRVRVNERHDIVLDVSSTVPAPNGASSADARINSNEVKTFKISGSAYKLTRTRSLHHGTCLLSSPHLLFLSRLLRSPAAPYIKARGVESVRSPVRNVGVSNAEFEDAVVAEFRAMYEDTRARSEETKKKKIGVEILNAADVQDMPEVRAGVAELRSRDWIYAQTPQFTFSSHPTADDPRPRPDLPTDLPSSLFPTSTGSAEATPTGLHITVRHAEIMDAVAPGTDSSSNDLAESLKGLHLHHIGDWRTHVGNGNESMGRWLNHLFGVGS
ncbi:hypothetical protein RRF57_012087 [Xylaria bambusicola]|uniref:Putative lipoate-protein ligase A n=1 Tax=Xylaria bambusicola TaxID=326684 RepID=A0AAN7UNY8_9PEZI